MKIKTKARIDHLEALLRRVREASRNNQRNHRVRQYLGSKDAMLLATLEAWEAMPRHLRPPKAKLPSIASRLDPWKGTDEPVRQLRQRKDTPPYYRTVFEFGIENRALQYLARNALVALLEPTPNQFGTRKGLHAAIEQVSQALLDGYVWAVELDIAEYYPSLDESRLYEQMLLPREVTDRVLTSQYLHILRYGRVVDRDDDNEDDTLHFIAASSPARRGIPTGSAASPVVADAMVAIALKQVPKLGVVTSYADNILLQAKSKADVESMTKALGEALEAHPVGRLRSRKIVFKPGAQVSFLGHVIWLTNGKVVIEPRPARIDEFLNRVELGLAYLESTTLTASALRRRRRDLTIFIQSWTESFKLCDGIEDIRAEWLAKVRARAKLASARKKKLGGNTEFRIFDLNTAQHEAIEAALKLAKEKSGTKFDTVALEYIAQEFMGCGMGFVSLKAALMAERKKSSSEEDFLTTLAGLVNTIGEPEGYDTTISFEPKA
jgi:hypothetical protein